MATLNKRDLHVRCNHSCGMTTFQVHSKLTLLCCAGCGAEIGRWEDIDDKQIQRQKETKVTKISKEILARQLTDAERENLR